MRRFSRRTAAVCAIFAAAVADAQESSSRFKAATVVGDAHTSLRAVADYDGDGAPDAVSLFPIGSADPQPYLLRGLRNVGGALVPDWSTTLLVPGIAPGLPPGTAPETELRAADLDLDGQDDVVVAGGSAVFGLRSNGAGVPPSVLWSWTSPTPLLLNSLAIGDFDLDGDDDAAVVGMPTPPGSPYVFTLRTVPGPTPLVGGAATLPFGSRFRLATLNLDGVAPRDLVCFVSQAFPGPTGHVATSSVSPLGVPGAVSTSPWYAGTLGGAVGDLDQDGDDDVWASVAAIGGAGGPPSGAGTYRRIYRNAGGTLVPEANAPGATVGLLADLDLDGDLDALGGIGGHFAVAETTVVTRVPVTLLDAAGAPTGSFDLRVAGAGAIAAVDLDGDGDRDMVFERSVYYAGGGTTPPYLHGGELEGRVQPGDFEGDGDPDCDAVGATLRNDGRGVFAPTAPGSPPAPGTVELGLGFRIDVDGDGDLDRLVAVGSPYFTATAVVRRLVNRGDGVCVDAGPAATATMAGFGGGLPTLPTLDSNVVRTGDFDGDGDQDVVVSGVPGLDGVFRTRVWLNDGAGFFAPQAAFDGFLCRGAADFDGDGLTDLVGFAGIGGLGAVEVRRAAGGGDFHAAGAPGGFGPPSSAPGPVGSVAIADFDGDGLLDVAAVESSGGTFLHWHRFTGSAYVSGAVAAADYPGFTTSDRLFAADLDADGDVDLAIETGTAGEFALASLSNDGQGAFAAPTVALVDALALADVDGDGDPDAIGRESVALNRRFSPATGGVRFQYGTGSAGSGGSVPVLGAAGLRGAGEIHEFRLRGCLGGAAGLFGAGALQLNQPLFGSTLLAFPEILLPFTTTGAPGVAGAGGYDLPFLVPPQIAGFPFFHQVAIADPAAPSGLAFSNGLMVVYGS